MRQQARQVCTAEGIVDSFLLESCIIDVGVTGNVNWAKIAAEMGQFIDPTKPSIFINPSGISNATLGFGYQLGAIVTGSDSTVVWTAAQG